MLSSQFKILWNAIRFGYHTDIESLEAGNLSEINEEMEKNFKAITSLTGILMITVNNYHIIEA